jgi:capsular polysaccharide export protein
VGLESLLLGKKVITLGNACYNIEQLVLHASNEQQLFTALEQLANWQFNETLRQNFLAYIADVYCIPKGWEKMLEQADEQHLQAIVKRILQTDTLAHHLKEL